MIHLYCGDGKGKTTAAMGLALRTAGRGGAVVIAQFLKGGDSGERYALTQFPQVTLLPVPDRVSFSFAMSPEERDGEQDRSLALLEQAVRTAGEADCALLLLDEVCGAVNTGLLPVQAVLSALDTLSCEIVLTGRDPHPELARRADYITCCQKIRHPFDVGKPARPGVEF